MVFCAYCGKSFTRKEHLERHIPSHTNVKPHRCTACGLGFSRRDLLQRHHNTYHEAKDPMVPGTNNISTLAGRSPIACLNCASAKTGCDKAVPCSRCAEKDLPCAARFARRATKSTQKPVSSKNLMSDGSSGKRNIDSHHASIMVHSTSQPEVGEAIDSFAHDSLDNPQQGPLHIDLEGFSIPILDPSLDLDDLMAYQPDFESNFQYHDQAGHSYSFVEDEQFDACWGQAAMEPWNMIEHIDESPASDMSLQSGSASISVPHSRSSSASVHSSTNNVRSIRNSQVQTPKHASAIIEGEGSWGLARCNQLSETCPRTALSHVEALGEQVFHDYTAHDHPSFSPSCRPRASRMTQLVSPSTWASIEATAQAFYKRAISTSRTVIDQSPEISIWQNMQYTPLLPPPNMLDYFVAKHEESMGSYISLLPGGTINVDHSLSVINPRSLLILLILAHGASLTPSTEAWAFAAGILEICRAPLFAALEENMENSSDPSLMQCAILFIMTTSWSGDKWHMDIAMRERGKILKILMEREVFKQKSIACPVDPAYATLEQNWQAWLQVEGNSRLAYNWALIDLELSLFYDTAPIVSITDVQAKLPAPEQSWKSANCHGWELLLSGTCANSQGNSTQIQPSLLELFQDLLQDRLVVGQTLLTPLQLRLLLHPICSMIFHVQQVHYCFSKVGMLNECNPPNSTNDAKPTGIKKAQSILKKWYHLSIQHTTATPGCVVSQTNLILYHLISLNLITAFPQIESLARKEDFDESCWDVHLRIKQCIFNRSEAIFHAGQVLRLLKMLPWECRPEWWLIAHYRPTLVLWADSLASIDLTLLPQSPGGPIIVVDETLPEDATLIYWMWSGCGIPALRRSDGGYVLLNDPGVVLSHCIPMLAEGPPARMKDGITRKLTMLHERWHGSREPGMAVHDM